MLGQRPHNIALRQDTDDAVIGAKDTTEPMCRSVSSFTAAARSAVGSIVTTLPPLAARIVLTFISSLLKVRAEEETRDSVYG
jgi:hypothetical protein